MLSILLIADDLTGALDSVVPFCAPGRKVAVAVDRHGLHAARASQPDILAVNSDSRGLAPATAARRVKTIWNALRDLAPALLIKKIDSRLSGHPAVETRALLAASGRAQAWICPAVPDMGRIVRHGLLTGAGVARPTALADHFAPSATLTLADAADAEELDHLARQIHARASTVLAVGARGLTQALAAHAAPAASPLALSGAAKLPILLAIGSRDPATAAQVQRLRESGAPIADIAAPGGHVPDLLSSDKPILLVRATDDGGDRSAGRVATRFADGIARLVRQQRPATLFACGGATAIAITRALGIPMLIPVGEAAPAMPVSRVPHWDGLHFITKSGGFGDADALCRLIASHAGLIPA